MKRKEQRQLLIQRRVDATNRYLRALTVAQAQKEEIEKALMLLHKAARKSRGCQFNVDEARHLSMYLDLLVTRCELLALNLEKRAVRAMVALRVAAPEDVPDDDFGKKGLFVIQGGKSTEPPTA